METKKKSTLFWVDDDPFSLASVACNLYPVLWTNEVYSCAVFFGDCYKRQLNQPDYTDDVCTDFLSKLASAPNALSNIRSEKTALIRNEQVKEVVEFFKEMKPYAQYDSTKVSPLVDAIKKIINDYGKKDSVIAIDLALLYGDIDRLTQNNTSILSMWLYKFLSDERKRCFLYTANYGGEFTNSWKEGYKTLSGSDFPVVFDRGNLIEPKENKELIERLINFIKGTGVESGGVS